MGFIYHIGFFVHFAALFMDAMSSVWDLERDRALSHRVHTDTVNPFVLLPVLSAKRHSCIANCELTFFF